MPTSFLEIPRARSEAIKRIAAALAGIPTVAVTTHINADGDAAGSVAAMARLLPQLGPKAIIGLSIKTAAQANIAGVGG